MKLNVFLYSLIAILLLSILISCNKESKFKDLYNGDLSKIDKIEVINGTNGEMTTIEDKQMIEAFINDMKNVVFVRKNEELKGYLYQLSFYEGNHLTFTMNDHSIDDAPYQPNNSFKELIERLIYKSDT